jgi:hypothetical protein
VEPAGEVADTLLVAALAVLAAAGNPALALTSLADAVVAALFEPVEAASAAADRVAVAEMPADCAAANPAPVEAAGFPAPRDEGATALVPSTRVGAPGSEAPNSISGSRKSADPDNVGTMAESGRASGASGPVTPDDEFCRPEAVGSKSSNAPCERRSSSDSIRPFAEAADAGADVEFAVEEPPAGEAALDDAKGSSTGISAKGSKTGREAASIVFEPDSGDQSWPYPAMPRRRHLGDGSQNGAAAPAL